MFDPGTAGDLDARYEFRLDDEEFHVEVAGGQLAIARGSADQPDAIVTTTVSALTELVFEGRPLADAKRTAEVEIEGSTPLVNRFLGLFPQPELAPLPARRGPLVRHRLRQRLADRAAPRAPAGRGPARAGRPSPPCPTNSTMPSVAKSEIASTAPPPAAPTM